MNKEAQIREITDILIWQPLVKDGVYKTAEALYAAGYRKLPELDKLQKQVELLTEGLEWALEAGGWRLWYYSSTLPSIIKVGRIGESAIINRDVLEGKDE